MQIKENLEALYENMEIAAAKAGRSRQEIELVVVTKTVEAERIQEIVDLGVTDLGENRVQEFLSKVDVIRGDVRWHIIGRLQKNKVKYIIERTKLVHSLCDLGVAQEMQRLCEKRGAAMDCLIELNVAGEESKAGLAPGELAEFLDKVAPLNRVHIKGLMTVAPIAQNPEDVRGYFASMKKLFDHLAAQKRPGFEMRYLSMGMTGDYKVAIEEGANMIRVGSALFGKRNY